MFLEEMGRATPSQRERMPAGMAVKVFKKSGLVTTKRLHFLQQLYILQLCLNKKIFIVVEGEGDGMGVEDFERHKKDMKKSQYPSAEAGVFLSTGTMVVGNKELIEWMGYLNNYFVGPAMNYALKLKNSQPVKFGSYLKEMVYFMSVLANYEGNKKKIIRHAGVTIPDWYVLMYLYDGKEKRAPDVYDRFYKDAINASRKQIMDSFKKNVHNGNVQAIGKAKATVYKITALGKSVVNDIVHKYIIP